MDPTLGTDQSIYATMGGAGPFMPSGGGGSPGLLGMLGMGAMANPIGAVGMLGGIGASIYGGIKSYEAAQGQFGAEQKIFGLEAQAEAQRKQMMELNARRSALQVVRNQQRARSMAVSTSTQQGAQFGSGVQGAYGQISGQSGVGLLGINQQLQAGENLFGINSQIMQQRQQYAQFGSQAYTGQAIGQVGAQAFNVFRSPFSVFGM